MNELKRFTIKTSYSTETYICYDIHDHLAEICFCDDYEVISEESAAELQPKFDKYFSRIPDEQFCHDYSFEFWKNNVLLLLKGWYETFEEMYEDCKQ